MSRFDKPMSWNKSSSDSPAWQSANECSADSSPHQTPAASWRAWSTDWSSAKAQRSYFLPIHYTKNYKYPLVVWLHSDGFNENQVSQVMPHVSLRNYVGVGVRGNRAADSDGHGFDWHQSPAAIGIAHDNVVDAAEEAADRFSIHPDRIVLAGYGSGGTMAMRIAMREPHRFAAAVSLGGRMPQGAIRNLNQLRRRRLPMLWQWGAENANLTTQSLTADCQAAMSIAAPVEIRQYPGTDEMDTVVLADTNEWIMRHVIGGEQVCGNDSERWATSPTAYSNN